MKKDGPELAPAQNKRELKLSTITVIVVVLVSSIGYVATIVMGDKKMTEQQECDRYCLTEYGLPGVLVPIITNQKTRPGASQGPYKCTCPRK